MKLCIECQTSKPLSEFHRRGVAVQSWCKKCRQTRDRARYQEHRGDLDSRHRRYRLAVKGKYEALKIGRPCVDCGGIFHHAAMQFDHLPGSVKVDDLANLKIRCAWKKILSEIQKCELVCANCHAVRTFERRQQAVAQPGSASRSGREGRGFDSLSPDQ